LVKSFGQAQRNRFRDLRDCVPLSVVEWSGQLVTLGVIDFYGERHGDGDLDKRGHCQTAV